LHGKTDVSYDFVIFLISGGYQNYIGNPLTVYMYIVRKGPYRAQPMLKVSANLYTIGEWM